MSRRAASGEPTGRAAPGPASARPAGRQATPPDRAGSAATVDPVVSRLPAEPADVVEAAVRSGLAVQTGPSAVEFGSPGSPPAATGPPAVARVVDPAAGPDPGATAAQDVSAEVMEIDTADDPDGTGQDPADLGALADELYERIEHRLRESLLLQRERLGGLPDP